MKVSQKLALLAALVSLATAILLNVFIGPPIFVENMPGGSSSVGSLLNPPDNTYGLFDPETTPDGTTFRWTGPHATITFPYAGHLGRYVLLTMKLAANIVPGQRPSEVTLRLNGQEVEHFTVSGPFQVYTATLDTQAVPSPNIDLSDVQVDIESSVVRLPQDGRELGVAIDSIELRPTRSISEILIAGLVWMLAILLVVAVAARRLSWRWAALFGLGALLSFAAIHITYYPRGITPTVETGLAGFAWLLAVLIAPRKQPAWGLAVALCGLWLLVAGRILGDWQVDDAYISYRYAWNLAHGNGLVYNPGEIVEGYTNFLWTLLAAFALVVGWQPQAVALAVTIGAAQGLVALTFYLGIKLAAGTALAGGSVSYLWAACTTLLVALDVNIITYGARGSGLESVPFALLVLLPVPLLWHRGEREPAWRAAGGVALALASLMRPEGMLVAALLLVVRAWQDYRHKTGKAGYAWARLLAYTVVPYCAIVLPYQVWRVLFYGYIFPNTFYAKTGTTPALALRGVEYIWQFAIQHWLVAALVLLGLTATLISRVFGKANANVTTDDQQQTGRNSEPLADRNGNTSGPDDQMRVALIWLVAVYIIYIVSVGGDWLPAQRFFIPLAVPIALLAQESARLWLARLRTRPALWRATGIALVVAALTYGATNLALEEPDGMAARGTQMRVLLELASAGLWLRDNTPPQTLIAAQGAGAIAYYSQRRTVDMFGLNDLHIGHLAVSDLGAGKPGHEKMDPAYVLDSRPDYIQGDLSYYFEPVAERFKEEYKLVTETTPTGVPVLWHVRRVLSMYK